MHNFFDKFKNYLSEKDYSKLLEKSQETFEFFTQGYHLDTSTISSYSFESNQEICLEGINFISMCKHHFLPFFGTCSLTYIPSNQILGLSRIKTIIRILSRKLTIQEELTEEIFQCIIQILQPKELTIVLRTRHTCTMMENLCFSEEVITTKKLN